MPGRDRKGDGPRLINPLAVLVGLGVTIFVSVITALLVALVTLVIDFRGTVEPFLRFVTYFSLFLGGLAAGARSNMVGWLHGALVGLIYFLGLFWLGRGMGMLTDMLLWGRVAFCLFAAFAGGIIGINLRHN
jgi:putative membrane protein (TIGR04086 family)